MTNTQHVRSRQRGFTLLEILMVVLIIGIITTFAALSMSGRALSDRLNTEARRLERLFVLAQEEAELQGVLLGFRVTAEQIQWVALGGDGLWQPYAEGGIFRFRAIEAPFALALRVEGKVVPPALEPDDADTSREPQVIFLSSGEVTAFSADVSTSALPEGYRLEVNALGHVSRRSLPVEDLLR